MYISPDIPYLRITDLKGSISDMRLLVDDSWLIDTEVMYRLIDRSGLWHLTMIYVAIENPLKLLCRSISVYHSEKKATTYARILQRSIRKDARGTLKTNKDDLNICDN